MDKWPNGQIGKATKAQITKDGYGAMAEPAGPGTSNPLLRADGTPRITPEPDGERLRWRDGGGGPGGSGLLRDQGERVVTHALHERKPRTYTIRRDPATPDEVDAVNEALSTTANGAMATRWRHPTDDEAGTSGNVETAPRWRIKPGASVRRKSPTSAAVMLELEEV